MHFPFEYEQRTLFSVWCGSLCSQMTHIPFIWQVKYAITLNICLDLHFFGNRLYKVLAKRVYLHDSSEYSYLVNQPKAYSNLQFIYSPCFHSSYYAINGLWGQNKDFFFPSLVSGLSLQNCGLCKRMSVIRQGQKCRTDKNLYAHLIIKAEWWTRELYVIWQNYYPWATAGKIFVLAEWLVTRE